MSNVLIKKYQKEIKALKEKCDLIDQVGDFNETTVEEYNRSTERIEELESLIKDLKTERFVKLIDDYSEEIYKTNAPNEEIDKAIKYYFKENDLNDYSEDYVVTKYLKHKGYYFKRIIIDASFRW